MNKIIMVLKIIFEWLSFPFVFLFWKLTIHSSDGLANDFLFWHLCLYSEMIEKDITYVTNKTYNGLTKTKWHKL